MSWDFWDRQYKSSSSTTRDFAATAPADPTENIVPADPTTGDFDPQSGGTIAGISPIKCFDSQDCASGWSCVGGRCKPPSGAAQSSSNTGSGTTAGCGSGVGDTGGGNSSGGAPGGGGGGCGAGTGGGGGPTGSGCTKTGPGSPSGGGGCGGGPGGGGADDCCGGERCCRNGTDCVCGPCPPPSGCNQYCAAEKSATGDSGAGCTEGEECDECEECRLGGFTEPGGELYKCRPKQGGPCNCPGNECRNCSSCNENGTCTQDDSRCLTCCNCFADCSCGVSVERRICRSFGEGYSGPGCSSICRAGLEKSCSEACPPDPDTPEPCDCNCDNDCGDCEICNAEGVCVPDPACGNEWVAKIPYWINVKTEYCWRDECSSSTGSARTYSGGWVGLVEDAISVNWAVTGSGAVNKPIPGCATSCSAITVRDGDPYDIYEIIYDGVPSGNSVRTIAEYCYTGIGFNSRNCWSIRGGFGVAVGYGQTREEALDNAYGR